MKTYKLTYRVLFIMGVLILFLRLTLSAQVTGSSGKTISFGIKAGYSNPVLTIDYQPSFDERIAPVIGGYFQFNFSSWISASLDVLYTQHGGNNISPLLIYSTQSLVLTDIVKTNLCIHSIEVPLTGKIGLPGMTGNVKPFISAGVSFGFFLQSNADNYFLANSSTGNPFYYSLNDVVSSYINTYDIACISGAGVEFYGDKLVYTMELFYRMGFTDLNVNHKTYAPDFRSNTFGLKIGIGL